MHQGKLDINGVAELSDTAANHLAGKSGMISEKDPREWIETRRV